MKFKKINGEEIDDIAVYLANYLKQDGNFELFIGCDSQKIRYKKTANYAIVICIYNKGKGAHILYRKEKRENIPSMHERLWWEVEYSMQVANYLKEKGILNNKNIYSVHLDLNSSSEFKSNQIYANAVGYVKGCGYDCRTKPNSPAASYAADMIVKEKIVNLEIK